MLSYLLFDNWIILNKVIIREGRKYFELLFRLDKRANYGMCESGIPKKAFRQRSLKILLPLQRLQQVQYIDILRIKKRCFFALIEDVYHYTLDFLDNAEPYDKVGIREAIERDSVEASYVQAMTYVNYMYEHLEEFQLFAEMQQGSRVENFIEEITIQYTKQNALFVKAAYEAGYAKCLPNDIEIHILTHGYITALCECVFCTMFLMKRRRIM